MAFSLRAKRAVWVGLVVAGPIAACSAKTGFDGSILPNNPLPADDSDSGGSSSGSPGVISGSSGNSSGNPGIIGTFMQMEAGPPEAAAALTRDAACDFSTMSGQQQLLDAYMMLDYSQSMTMDGKWQGVTDAITSFVQQPTTGISVGLQYFSQPLPDAGALAGLIPGTDDSCDPSVYANPAIEIQPLPGVSTQILASLAKHKNPNTGTPTVPALKGAIEHATVWAKAHPSDATVVILATDGDPDDCGSTKGESAANLLTDVEAAAAAGVAQTPKIVTFVIGVGSSTANLDGIAAAGGTGSAFIVDTTMSVSTQFLAALNKIRAAALGCEYKIPLPESGTVNFKQINVQFAPIGGSPETVPQVSDKSKCPTMGDAWYYDNPTSPSEILLCSTTCGSVSTGGTVNVLTGCETVTVVPPPTR